MTPLQVLNHPEDLLQTKCFLFAASAMLFCILMSEENFKHTICKLFFVRAWVVLEYQRLLFSGIGQSVCNDI